ncbi:wyosine [tRNA(Phe)-imidazoG37] synthetase (radical SAM superfamily) [Hypnocyclicus thermotrophus]|uniref:Wyosine [tRNA(Phe)-imidazoG37] synthetase (Radical SAM superfamily) n=1 Tax=Hypnocyclicus thermotrophus TaxID=1627895 RepID=A0AA46DXC9_9FUSO|nr:radical SAM protein [Hypnocyclicus thermotrophus]TDT68003.1 wyosine [tRNA(Phe)-imidazoG37] synthetase (radical SAM superfamily) [Hypnocyclicus thermotrophus]
MKYKYIFGPVPSRRLKISLGVDLLKEKICNFNCVYCECGASDKLFNERKKYTPINEVLAEIKDYLEKGNYLDFITFSGNGEPTLHSEIGYLIKEIKKITNTKICVITNSSLLNKKNIREEIMQADIIMPSLDAISENVFRKIDRASSKIKLLDIKEGIKKLSEEYKGKIWLEIFFIEGLNDTKEELDKFIEYLKEIKINRIQLNSLDRPAPEKWVKAMKLNRLEEIKKYFSKELKNVEIIKKYKTKEDIFGYTKNIENFILELIDRRPSTFEDMKEILKIEDTELNKYLEYLENKKEIKKVIENRGIFYKKNIDKKY